MELTSVSKQRLSEVRPELQLVVNEAAVHLDPSPSADGWGFIVVEGLRSLETQKRYVEKGVSWTMDSRHITGHAVDLGVWITSPKDVRWEAPLYVVQARFVQHVAQEIGVRLTWGGIFDMCLNDLSPDIEKELQAYRNRCAKRGKKAIFDGPHFELTRKDYPNEQ